jgi:hypothetical protein
MSLKFVILSCLATVPKASKRATGTSAALNPPPNPATGTFEDENNSNPAHYFSAAKTA